MFLAGVLLQTPVTATMTASANTPVIGEAITLTITFEAPRGTVVAFDIAEPTDEHVRLSLVNADVSDIEGDRARYTQTAVLILLAPGTFTTPPAAVQYTIPDSAPQQIAVEPLEFTISSVLDPNDLTLRPFGAPGGLTVISPVLLGGVILAVSIVSFAAYRLRGQFQRFTKRATHLRWGSRTEAGLRALARLNQVWRTTPLTPAQYAQVADILREYVSRRFGVKALELTTDEAIQQLAEQKLVQEYSRRELHQILETADLVKFAGEQDLALEHAIRETVKKAVAWVRHVEQSVMIPSETTR
jgi:hypothetical protein